MEVHYGYRDLWFRDPVITMGVFDGVHLGHRRLLQRVTEEARNAEADSVAVTFDPHPCLVLNKGQQCPAILTDIEERKRLVQQTGVGHLVIIPFTTELSRMTATEFVKEILCRRLRVRHLITGYDHRFGRRQEGDTSTITECSEEMDFKISREAAYCIEDEVVSSSHIRKALSRGEVEKAASMLGYNYFLTGRVVSGKKIGRHMGFPTANIVPLSSHKLVPMTGVYAVEVTLADKQGSYPGMLNIGTRPTIIDSDGRQTIEVHLIDFKDDLYGRVVTLHFRHWLRDEMKFDGVAALTEQLAKDREMTLDLMTR